MKILNFKINSRQMRVLTLMAAMLLMGSLQHAAAFAPTIYTDSSKLATGTWVKIKVTETGIHAITASDAHKWGFSDLSKIRVFGYGGGQISEKLTADQPDDLPQIPLMRTSDKVLFYAQGPTTWTYTSTSIPYREVQHPYSTAGYYFVTDNSSYPDLTVSKATTEVSGSNTINTFTERLYHEEELVNPGETGRQLLGEDFRYTTTQSFKFALTGYVEGSTINVLTSFAAKAMAGGRSKVTFQYNGTNLTTSDPDYIDPVTSINHDHYNLSNSVKSFKLNGTNDLTYSISFTPSGTLYLARLNYITVNYKRSLALNNGLLYFGQRNGDTNSIYEVSNCSSATHVWDVTTCYSPIEMNTALSGTNDQFSPVSAGDHEYAAFNDNATFPSPTFAEKVANQNIHGQATPDMIIISPTAYLAQAQRVANMHATVDSMRVLVVDQNNVFNEFSSGTPDAMAYRKICKLFYDRGADARGHSLRYLLLFGNGSYDNRQLTEKVKLISYPMLLTWESEESSNENTSYTSDDPFVVLADNSGPSFEASKICVSVGRFPVKSVSEARTAVDKLLNYVQKPDYGSWKNNVLDIADDEDNAIHMEQAENVITTAKANGADDFIFNRVYIDAFTSQSVGSGRYYPEARSKMFRLLDEGVLWWNFTGHASPTEWTADGLLTHTDILESLFYKHQPVLYAATCEFTRYDADDESGGENMFLNSQGGAVALISPPRLVYIPNNGALNASVAKYIFRRDDSGLPLRIGDILTRGKNDTGSDDNNSRYFLFGDPAMRLAYPTYHAKIETINGKAVSETDMPVFQGRQTITLTGSINDRSGNKATKFNGSVISTLYDSEQSITTNGYGENGAKYTYLDRPNKLAICVDSVSNGNFTVTITIPSEIVATYDNYSPALINLYAYDSKDSVEAMGSNSDFYIYGYDDTAKADTVGPDIKYFGLNSENFKDGDNVNESPLVLASISDESGINFSTGGIGHSMTLSLDDKTSYNDITSYYTPTYTEKGSAGSISYALSSLADGNHTLELKVWDVYNNSSEKTIDFNVITGLKPDLYDVYCDANPASVETNFYVKHNRPDAVVSVKIEIFDLMGRQIWSTSQTGKSDMFTSFPITWDLTNYSGSRVQRGIYIYRATISTDGVQESTKSKKIAVTGE
jgi:hypothetical protein